MSINHSAGCADANECFFTPRAEATGTLGYRSLIIFVLSIISWALVVAIVVHDPDPKKEHYGGTISGPIS